MKISKKIIIAIFLSSIFTIGCSTNKDNISMKNIENNIPYIDEYAGEIDNNIIEERYENVKKEELSYESERITKIYSADPTKEIIDYRNILLGFTYFSEMNPTDLTYDEAIELVKKVLPDDIKQVDKKIDDGVNKEYIYYESSKGNFRVGICYGYEFNNENVEVVNKNKIVGIDYSKEIN